MEGRPKTTGMIRLLWSLILGLGLALGLLWALMPRSTIEAQAVNPGFTVDLTYEAVWGLVNPGDVATVTRTAGGAAYGAAEADGVGFFWTPVWQSNGQPADIAGGDTIEVYVNGALAATLNPLNITGQVDVLNDQVVGTIGGDTGGTPVTVTLGIWALKPLAGAPQVTTVTGAGGTFTADFGTAGYDLGPHNYARVEYAASPDTVQSYLYPNEVFHVDTFGGVWGYAAPMQTVTVTLVRGSAPLTPTTTTANWPHGDYWADADIEPDDDVEVDLGGGTVISTTAYNLTVYMDVDNERVTGTCPPNETVRVWAMNWRLGTYAETSAIADASGHYTATFTSYDLKASDAVYPAFADDEGNEVLLSTAPPGITAFPEQDGISGSGDAPNVPYTATLYHAPDTYVKTGTTQLMWNGTGWVDFGVDIAPGDVITLETATWVGVMTVADLSFDFDTANDRVLGEADIPGWVRAWVQQWQGWAYAVHGMMGVSTTVSYPFTATFTGFDLRDSGYARITHYDTNDFTTRVDRDLRFSEVHPPHGVGGVPPSADEVVTAWLYASDGTALLASTSDDHDDNPWRFWLDFGKSGYDIEPGHWVTVTSESGWTAGLQVPDLTVQADEDTDLIWGEGPKALVFVEHGWKDGWDGRFVPVDDYALDRAFFGGDIQWGDNIATTYQALNGNRVRRDFRWPHITARYDMGGGNTVVGHNAFLGNTIYITVTDPGSSVVATGTTTAGACEWGGPDEYCLDFPEGTLVPSNTVTVDFGDGCIDSVHVVTITSYADPGADIVTGTAPVEGQLHAWSEHRWGERSPDISVQVDASGVYTMDFGAEGWDIQYGDEFHVYYQAPHDHEVEYWFWLGAPELSINKWNTSGYARPGGVVVYGIEYRNDGNGTAENTLIVDTLPPNTTWAGDTSGVVPDIGASGVITWNLGDLEPDDRGAFMVTLNVSGLSDGDTIGQNCAVITTTTPGDYDLGNNDSCADTVDVWDDEVEINVGKRVHPDDPTPGQEFNYTVWWCNNRGAAAGPVWLTDTLPLSTTLVSWTPERWREPFWSEVVTTGGQLVLCAPGLPGDRCGDLNLTLLLDADAPISTTLQNTVVITTAGDVDPDNNMRFNDDAHVSPPRYDMRLDKRVHSYVPVPGEWINYFIWYGNDGNMVTHVWVTDTVPNGLSYEYARWGGGDQPQADEPLPDPTIIGNQLVWDLGEVPVGGSRWFHVQMNISDTFSAGDVLTNCATIGIDGTETTPRDNTSCYPVTLNPPGPNLRVTKSRDWHGDGQLGYRIRFESIGDETVNNVWITDTLPTDTTWDGSWSWDFNFDWDRLISDTQSSDVLRWQFDYLEPGDYGEFEFNANLDFPGAPLRWYTNTVEIDTPPDDANPTDNTDTDVAFSGGEVDWVDLDVYSTRIWGCGYSDPVTVTTAHEQRVYGGNCWDDDFSDPFQPGDVVTIEAGAAAHPVVIHVPDPFDATADSDTDTVWGQIDALDHEWVTVDLDDGPALDMQTDGSGNFSATFPDDVPRGGQGEVRYRTEIDYADVTFHRRFQTLDLIITVDYEHDWVNSNYEAGHTVWITVTESDGFTVKATAELTTGPIPEWGGDSGFETHGEDWSPSHPDIQPGDWVYGLVNSATYTTTVHVGTINGQVNVDADTVSGTIDAPWLAPALVTVSCEIHEENGESIQVYNVYPDGGRFFCDFSGLWDIQPGHNVAVNYTEPDRDRVQTHPPNPAPYLRINKRADGSPSEGGHFAFPIRYWNDGGAPAENTVITDTLLGGVTYITDTSSITHTGSGTPADPIVWDLGTLPASSSGEFYVFVEVTAVESDTITNSAQIATSNPYDQGDPGEKESTCSEHVQSNDTHLNVGKSAWTGDPAPDTDFVYSVNVCNNGSTASSQVTLTDTLCPSMTLQTWWGQHAGWTEVASGSNLLVVSRPSLPGGWCSRVYLRVHLDESAWPGMYITNTAVISATNDLEDDDNETTYGHNVGESHTNLNIEKWFEAGQLVPGGEVMYEFNYGNNGNLPVDNVLITETLPVSTTFNRAWRWTEYGDQPFTPTQVTADYVIWDIGTLDNGYNGDIYFVLDVDSDASPGTVLTNTVEISPQPDEDEYDDNTSTVVETLHNRGPNLRVDKYYRWDGESQVFYGIFVKNLGTTPMENIWITDTYPISTTWSGDFWVGHGPWFTYTHDAPNQQFIIWAEQLDPGGTGHVGFWVDLDESIHGVQGLVFTNTVEAPWPGDVYPADNTDVELAYTGPDLYAEKWISGGEPRPGARITFTLRCGNKNVGPWDVSDGTTTRLTERLPDGMSYVTSVWSDGNPHTPFFYDPGTGLIIWDMGRLGSDDYRWFYLVVDLDADLEGDDVLLNQLEFQESPVVDIDPNPDNNTFELPMTILNPKFKVDKTYESSGVAGMVVTYALTVTNVGSEDGTNVVLSDTVPAGLTYGGSDGSFDGSDVTWTFGSIAANGGTATGWFWGTLDCTAGLSVENERYRVVSSDQGITTPDGDPVSFTIVAPSLSPAFDQSATEVMVGETVYFTDTSTTDGAAIVVWAWDFGDGETGNGATALHTYDAPGAYTVTLTITDTCGFSDSTAVSNAVIVSEYQIYLPLVLKNHS